jgi:hypothetical protein
MRARLDPFSTGGALHASRGKSTGASWTTRISVMSFLEAVQALCQKARHRED